MIYKTGDLVYVKSKVGFLKKEISIFKIKCEVSNRMIETDCFGIGARPYTQIKGYLIKEIGKENAKIKFVSPKKILGVVQND